MGESLLILKPWCDSSPPTPMSHEQRAWCGVALGKSVGLCGSIGGAGRPLNDEIRFSL